MAQPFQPQKFIAANVRAIPPSGIRDFFDLVQGIKNVISLGIGEPDFVTPWHIREAAIYALERGKTSYTSNLGLLRLREAIAVNLRKKFGIGYDPASEILKTAEREQCDLIAMTTHGHRFIGDLIFGSTIHEARHRSSIPVLLVRAEK